MSASDRERHAFDAATAIVTCLIAGDRDEARRITYSADTLHPDMILILAEGLAQGHTAESWRAAVLTAYSQPE